MPGVSTVALGAVAGGRPPDIVLVAALWPERALVRAQLIEEGIDVAAYARRPLPTGYSRPA